MRALGIPGLGCLDLEFQLTSGRVWGFTALGFGEPGAGSVSVPIRLQMAILAGSYPKGPKDPIIGYSGLG